MDEKSASPAKPEQISIAPLSFESSDFKVLQPLEKVASYLAMSLFVVIAAVVTTVIADWLLHRPPDPVLASFKPEDQKAAIENFKLLSDVAWDRTSRTFDLIVIKALLPVFATIVGYLLGKRQ